VLKFIPRECDALLTWLPNWLQAMVYYGVLFVFGKIFLLVYGLACCHDAWTGTEGNRHVPSAYVNSF